jgi:hypothetical protein
MVVTGICAEISGRADKAASPGFGRIGPMSALQGLLAEHGLDGAAIIAEAGIKPGALERPENSIRVTALGNLLARCADVTGCTDLGVSLGLAQALHRSASLDRS